MVELALLVLVGTPEGIEVVEQLQIGGSFGQFFKVPYGIREG